MITIVLIARHFNEVEEADGQGKDPDDREVEEVVKEVEGEQSDREQAAEDVPRPVSFSLISFLCR
jgi:hypothetical protein